MILTDPFFAYSFEMTHEIIRTFFILKLFLGYFAKINLDC